MTTATINRKRVTLTIQNKAHLLTVFSINEANRLAVTSGSEPNTAYVVRHDGRQATYCPCKAYGYCSHKQAVDWKLEAERRAAYIEIFNIYG